MYQQPCANLPMPELLLLYDQMIFKALQRLLIEFDFPRDDVVQKYRNGETDRGASLGVQSRTSFKVVLRLKEHEGQEMRVLSYKGKAIENVK